MSTQPLVSCIMPTYNRRALVPRAIEYFLRQDYPNKELVIVDDGSESVGDLVPADPQVRYVRLPQRTTLGTKRNLCVEASRGDLIMHWDDDDWMASHRISYQVEELSRAGGQVCGVRQMLFYEPSTGHVWLYDYPASARPWLAGGSLLYTRDFWRRAPFPAVQVGSDTRFVWRQRLDRAVVLPDYRFYVAMIHKSNTSPKRLKGSYWSRWEGDIGAVMGEDADYYRLNGPGPNRNGHASGNPLPPPASNSDALLRAGQSTISAQSAGAEALERTEKPEHARPTAPQDYIQPPHPRRQQSMRIGYVLDNFPALSETFIRREVLALCEAGHRVFVYTRWRHHDPLVPEPLSPMLTIRQVQFGRGISPLARAARADGVEHLHSSLMFGAQRAAYAAAKQLQVPFTLTAYSGHDVFSASDRRFYADITADPLCAALIVEDPFMRDWVVNHLGAEHGKIEIIPNSFDLTLYRLDAPRQPHVPVVILAIARFVEKKGLLNLVLAVNQLCGLNYNVELRLVGQGPEESRLRRAAGHNPRIRFLGSMTEEQTRRAYVDADIFCLPCVHTARGDADGVPTTVLEAMAYELPVVSSNLLSLPFYVRDGEEGLLAAPGDIQGIAAALGRLCLDTQLRTRLGKAGRARVEELCDLGRNVERLQSIIMGARARRWRDGLDVLVERRKHYTPETEAYYTARRERAIDYFRPQGRLLDIGCGHGKIRSHLPPDVTYIGCDPLPGNEENSNFPFVAALAESLPFSDATFDSALLYSVLPHVLDVGAVLAEAARVLKPGGYLYLHECVNDPNPIHINHLSDAGLKERVGAHFNIAGWQQDGPTFMLIKAQKPQPRALTHVADEQPLVSVAITTYNRGRFLRTCIDSVLKQTYRPVEVVVVDDGSTDDTRQILEEYGGRIRVAYNDHNRGIAFSKNRALAMTSDAARYVAMLDSDDYFRPRFIERCVSFLEHAPDIGLVYADDILVDEWGRELRKQPAVEPWSLEAWLRTCNLRGDTWLARRSLVMQTRLHDENLHFDVDYDLFYQLLELSSFAHLPEFLVCIRKHSGQTTRNRMELAKCHAANLVKYGYSPEYAYLRARHNQEWIPAIREGIALGEELRNRKQ